MILSIVICTFNREKVFCETLAQVLRQKTQEIEVIIIDQTHEHESVTSEYLDVIKGSIKYFRMKEPNLPAARNYGISVSQGEFILFLDDDMSFETDFFDKFLGIVKSFKGDALTVLSRSLTMSVDQVWDVIPSRHRENAKAGAPRFFEVYFLPGYFMLYRASVFKRIGQFDEWIGTQPHAAGEDVDFSLRVQLHGKKLEVYTGLSVIHLAEQVGGCEVRTDYMQLIEKKRFFQLANYFYSIRKNVSYWYHPYFWKHFIWFVIGVNSSFSNRSIFGRLCLVAKIGSGSRTF